MKLKPAHKMFLGLFLGAAVLSLLKKHTIAPAAMLAVGLIALIIPIVAQAIDTVVSKLIGIIGICLSAILLFVSFYLVMTPVAWISRLFGRTDSLVLKKPSETNFRSVEKKIAPDSFDKMW